MLGGKVKYIYSMQDFESGYLLSETAQEGLTLRRYNTNGKYEVVYVFPKGWSLLNEYHWNSCIQEARKVSGKKQTIYVLFDEQV